eukprot:gene6617-8188_t
MSEENNNNIPMESISLEIPENNNGNPNQNNPNNNDDTNKKAWWDKDSDELKLEKKKAKEIQIKDSKEEEVELGPTVSFFSMFRFATTIDKIQIVVGFIASILVGCAMPMFSIIFGRILNSFSPQDPEYDLLKEVSKLSLIFVYIGIGVMVCCYLEVSFWMMAGERQAIVCRKKYFEAILRQEIGWYDVTKSSELSTKISNDTHLFQDAIGEKIGNFVHNISTFIAGFVVGLIYGWQLTLVILSITPLIIASGAFMAKTMTDFTKESNESYSKAGGIAEEKIGSIRTVATFSGHGTEVKRYTQRVYEALTVGRKKAISQGIGMGAVFLCFYGAYSLAFWYGAKLISDKTWNPVHGRAWTGGDVLTIFFAVIFGAAALGNAAPHIGAFASGRAAAYRIYDVIDRASKIDPLSKEGIEHIAEGDIEFRNIKFSYPSRPDVPIFNDFNLKIEKGQTVALVGDSGGGKSTVIGLLERFYDPSEGSVFLDGIDIKQMNVKYLRQNIGLVSQEPVLFAMSIVENIRYGNDNASMEQIIEACRTANCHDFISSLPEGYNTQVGEKGVQMSGGQKQRIAIARAMIKNPKILLLDEATSALDAENEFLVQQAIDKLMRGRTTIVIAHRLTTIRDADSIAVVRAGQVVEKGTHSELLEMNGVYTSLVNRQQSKEKKDKKALGKKKEDSTSPSTTSPTIDPTKADDTGSDVGSSSIDQSDSEMEEENKKKMKKLEKKEMNGKVSMRRIFKFNEKDWPLFISGIIGAIINGALMPIFSILFSEIVKVFQDPDPAEIRSGSKKMAMWFAILAAAAGIANFLQTFSFTYIGEKLTYHLRRLSFRSIMSQDVGWFDLPANATGVLTTNLATDATLVQGVTSQRLGLVFQNIVTIVAGLIIAFIAGWKLSLVVVACIPIVAIAGKLEMDFLVGFSHKGKKAYARSGHVASEAIGGVRTIASFTSEEKTLERYYQCLEAPAKLGIRRSNVSGAAFGASQCTIYFIMALTYWYGAKLVTQGEWPASDSTIRENCINPDDFANCKRTYDYIQGYSSMNRVIFAVILSAMTVGNTLSFLPDVSKAKTAALSIFRLMDRVSPIDPFNEKGTTVQDLKGTIEYRNISFNYPSRPNRTIFQGFNLTVPAGKKVALVGDSGGGKSTVISLLERFYDPLDGEVLMDGVNIKDLNLNWLRSQIGLVGQEPFLFSGTIFENITYGKPGATMDEVIEACKSSNAHTFIEQLPDGYHTQLGDKFTQLSGGQKQRVAIARAIIRNPKILLLDEATSALDSQSEKIVQEALENVMKGRTSIVIAHRLSTVIDSDIIAVVKGGKVVEQGTHDELLSLNGFYSQLISRQL